VDGADVGMVQQRRGSGLTSKALQRFRVAGEVFGNELESNVPAQLKIFRVIHDAHTPASQLAEDAVMGNLLADHRSEMLPGGRGNVRPPFDSGQLRCETAGTDAFQSDGAESSQKTQVFPTTIRYLQQ
jgi:hypothetical protein